MRALVPMMALGVMLLCGCGGPSSQVLLREALAAAGEQTSTGWTTALAKVEKVVHRGDVSAPALNLYTICLARTAQGPEGLEKARAAAERSVEHFPKDFLSNYLLGIMLYDAGKFDEAVAPLHQAHLADPRHVDAHLLLTLAGGRAAKPEAGALFKELYQMPEFAKNPAFLNEWGLYELDMGQSIEALRVFNLASKLPGSDPGVTLNLAVFYDQYLQRVPRASRKERAWRLYIDYLTQNKALSLEKRKQIQQRVKDLRSEQVSSI